MFYLRGKRTPRRKVKKVHKSAGTDDKKLQTSLKKLNVQPIQAIEEVNMFKEDGNVIHFAAPKGMQTLEPPPAVTIPHSWPRIPLNVPPNHSSRIRPLKHLCHLRQ